MRLGFDRRAISPHLNALQRRASALLLLRQRQVCAPCRAVDVSGARIHNQQLSGNRALASQLSQLECHTDTRRPATNCCNTARRHSPNTAVQKPTCVLHIHTPGAMLSCNESNPVSPACSTLQGAALGMHPVAQPSRVCCANCQLTLLLLLESSTMLSHQLPTSWTCSKRLLR